MIILVDTDVLLDVIQKRQPFHIAADKLWKLVETGGVGAYVSAISFNNVLYIARKQLGRDAALRAVQIVRRMFRVVPLDLQIIDAAIATALSDFEDAIQASAAKQIGASHVITRNTADFRPLGVSAMNAEDFLAAYQP